MSDLLNPLNCKGYPVIRYRWLRVLIVVVMALQGVVVYAQDSDEEVVPEDQEVLVGWLELTGGLREGTSPFAWVSEDEMGPSLEGVVGQLRTVRDDERYLGLILFMNDASLSLAQVQTLSKEVKAVREAGKKVLAFGETYSTKDYVLASSADLVLLQHKGAIELSGVSVEEMYLAGLLEKIGAKAELLQIGQYKGANEALTRRKPSEAWNKNIEGLLDDLHSQIVNAVMENREMAAEQVDELFGRTWAMTDEELVEAGLVDHLVRRDLISVTEIEFGDGFQWDKQMGMAYEGGGFGAGGNPMAMFQLLFKQRAPAVTRETVAVVHCSGPIYGGESSRGDGMFSDDQIGSKTVTKLLARLKGDENVKGVVLRIDSPGGSALASEVMWQSIRELGEKKPVYVSVGGMAASGGYYMACAGDEVFVSPSSVVGSIGVVSGKIILGGLYEKIGVEVTSRSRGKYGDLFSSTKPFSTEQRELMLKSMQNIYDQFKDRVKRGRGSRLMDLEAVDEGMLFTGQQAVELGMADQVGDLKNSIDALVGELALEEGAFDVKHFPEPVSLPEFLNGVMGVSAKRVDVSGTLIGESVKRVLGEQAWVSVSRVLDGMLLLKDEPVLTILPVGIVVK
ncbi:Protease 4 [Poriferisphaera corsica]|uniref:Protease 4 n=1 Tax=Poriferisphaera corsica TaxID=2528020 RepID=A0A517YVH2_9BACT|nr:signal peptide peptidase SppA [Poriferisphaera corsica]QDU34235.1 Protease 4 [Poriferisphaera corsica]